MAFEKAKEHLKKYHLEDRIKVFEISTATVELAAEALSTQPERIAKSLTFMVDETPIMIVCAGDAKVSNSKYKAFFGTKAKMLSPEQVSSLIGHDIGGVCPFGINDGVKVYLDSSMKRFDYVYPACGSHSSTVFLTLPELEKASEYIEWIDVCNIPE